MNCAMILSLIVHSAIIWLFPKTVSVFTAIVWAYFYWVDISNRIAAKEIALRLDLSKGEKEIFIEHAFWFKAPFIAQDIVNGASLWLFGLIIPIAIFAYGDNWIWCTVPLFSFFVAYRFTFNIAPTSKFTDYTKLTELVSLLSKLGMHDAAQLLINTYGDE